MDALLRRRMMFDTGSAPPPAPAPVFYDRLVFDGTAYIETDIVPDANASFRVELGNESQKVAQRFFLVQAANDKSIGALMTSGTTSTNRMMGAYYGADSGVVTNKTLAFSTSRYNLFLTPKRFGWGSQVFTFTKGANAPIGHIFIGQSWSENGQAYTGKMGTFLIYASDAQDATSGTDLYNNYTPVYTLRPCEYEGEKGLWCMETSRFYGNSADGGAFTVENVS